MESNFQLSWLKRIGSESRLQFIKAALMTLEDDREVYCVKKMTKHLLSKKGRKLKRLAKISGVVSPSKEVVCPPEIEAGPSSRYSSYLKEVVGPPSGVVCPPSEKVLPGWLGKYNFDDIVALDCEFVDVFNNNDGFEIQRYKMKPENKGKAIHNPTHHELASVAVVNAVKNEKNEYKVLLNKMVLHECHSYEVNKFTRKVNGFEVNTLMAGEPKSNVIEEVKKLIAGKLIIVCGGDNDFTVLGLNNCDYDVWELQDHYWIEYINDSGRRIEENCGLGRIFWHYKGYNPQKNIHSAVNDCRIILEVLLSYINDKDIDHCYRVRDVGYTLEQFPQIPKSERLL